MSEYSKSIRRSPPITRSKQLVLLAENHSLLKLPKWETTKGLEEDHKKTAIQRWIHETKMVVSNEEKKSGDDESRAATSFSEVPHSAYPPSEVFHQSHTGTSILEIPEAKKSKIIIHDCTILKNYNLEDRKELGKQFEISKCDSTPSVLVSDVKVSKISIEQSKDGNDKLIEQSEILEGSHVQNVAIRDVEKFTTTDTKYLLPETDSPHSSSRLSESMEEPYSPDVSEYLPSISSSSESGNESTIIRTVPKIVWSDNQLLSSDNEYKTLIPEQKSNSMIETQTTENPDENETISTSRKSNLLSDKKRGGRKEVKSVSQSDDTIDTVIDNHQQFISKDSAKKNQQKEKKVIRKPDFCFFCESDVLNFARHLKRNHLSEMDVAKIFSLPINCKERKDLITVLRKKGNFVKNSQICEKPVRSAQLEGNRSVPCKYCLGFYSSKLLYRHVKICKQKNGEKTGSCLADAQNVMLRNIKVDKELTEKVFPKMLPDKISLEAKSDKLICMFGARYIKSHREKHLINVCSRKMRELAKLLLEIKRQNSSIKTLLDALSPENFDLFVSCVKVIAKYDPTNDNYQSPSYAMNISTSLKQCCDIAVLSVLKQKSVGYTKTAAEKESSIKALKELFEHSWRFEISMKAAADLNTHKWNKISILPLAQDLKIFKAFLEREGAQAFSELKANVNNEKAYKALAETIFCRLLLLNRKRVGELQRMPIHLYNAMSQQNQNYEEFAEAVTPTEKILLNKFKRVVIRGKRGRGVPVLFSLELQEHTEKLIELRNNFIKENNPFLFAQTNTHNPIQGYKIMQKYARKCGAKNPNALTSTRLRKHLATLSQLFSMTNNEIEQLATFMGHTENVHKQVYRLPDDVYQTAKISKLLLLMEKGQAAEYKGKTLDEIDIDLDIEVDQNEPDDLEEPQVNDTQLELTPELPDTSSSSHVDISNVKRPKRKQKFKRVPWTEMQKETARSFFDTQIKYKKPPKRLEVEDLFAKNPGLYDNKSWQQVKVFIQNIYAKK